MANSGHSLFLQLWLHTDRIIETILYLKPVMKTKFLASWMVEMFYLSSTLNFGIPSVLVFQLQVYYKVDRLLTGLTAQQKGTTARWYSNKTSLYLGWILDGLEVNE